MVKSKPHIEPCDNIEFVARQCQSYNTLVSGTNSLSTEKWYKARETSSNEEEARLIVTAVNLIRNKKINFQHCATYCPSVEVVFQHNQSFASKLFEIFMSELIKNPIKQQSLLLLLLLISFLATVIRLLLSYDLFIYLQ